MHEELNNLPKTKKKRYSHLFKLSEGIEEMFQLVHTELRSESMAETVRYLIKDGYYKYVENYKKTVRPKKTPVEKAKELEERHEASVTLKKDREIQKMTRLCGKLGGEVASRGGFLYCDYTRFEEIAAGEVLENPVSEPFSTMNETLLDYQYLDIMGQNGDMAKKKIISLMKK